MSLGKRPTSLVIPFQENISLLDQSTINSNKTINLKTGLTIFNSHINTDCINTTTTAVPKSLHSFRNFLFLSNDDSSTIKKDIFLNRILNKCLIRFVERGHLDKRSCQICGRMCRTFRLKPKLYVPLKTRIVCKLIGEHLCRLKCPFLKKYKQIGCRKKLLSLPHLFNCICFVCSKMLKIFCNKAINEIISKPINTDGYGLVCKQTAIDYLHEDAQLYKTFNVKQHLQYRLDDFLGSVKFFNFFTFGDAAKMDNDYWLPLVISTHSELVLQHNPPTSLIVSLLEASSSQPLKANVRTMTTQESIFTVTKKCQLLEQKSSDFSIPPGITIALTRNFYVHVHSTKLTCCLNQDAWCFSSDGLRLLGQHEIVILVKKRPNEIIPPLEIFYQFWLIYESVINKQLQTIRVESSNLVDKLSNCCPFQSHDCFFGPNSNATPDCNLHSSQSTTTMNIPYGFVFFHSTHQCLKSLHLPKSPYLFGLLILWQEAAWACRLPSRLLTCLGQSTRYYPNPLLSDRDRNPLFDCCVGHSFIDLFVDLHRVPLDYFNSIHNENNNNNNNELLFRYNGLMGQLNLGNKDVAQNAQLEIFIPLRAHKRIVHFLDSLSAKPVVFALAADCNPFSNSHLCCVQFPVGQSDSGRNSRDLPGTYVTKAISMGDATPRIIGVNFVAFLADSAAFNVVLVEDGVCVHLPSQDVANLISSLKEKSDFYLSINRLHNNHNNGDNDGGGGNSISVNNSNAQNFVSNDEISHVNSVRIRWFDKLHSLSSVHTNDFQIDLDSHYQQSLIGMQYLHSPNTYLVPVQYQLLHWLQLSNFLFQNKHESCFLTPNSHHLNRQIVLDSDSMSHRFIWTKLRLFNGSDLEHSSFLHENDGIQLTNELVRKFVQVLLPHLSHLRLTNRTQISLRVEIDQELEKVAYQMEATQHNGHRLDTNKLVLNSWSKHKSELVHVDQLSIGLNFVILPTLQSWLGKLKAPLSGHTVEFDFSILD